jgi:hypothetical protein
VFPLVFAAIGGGLVTAAATAPLGAISSALLAPLGGSFFATLVAALIARRRGANWQSRDDLDEQTDAMVAALRGVAAQAEQDSGLGRAAEGSLDASNKGVQAA